MISSYLFLIHLGKKIVLYIDARIIYKGLTIDGPIFQKEGFMMFIHIWTQGRGEGV
jgi:hypothetical protein